MLAGVRTPDSTLAHVNSWGYSHIAADSYSRYLYQFMYWHDPARLAWFKTIVYPWSDQPYNSTWELDTFFYNYDGKAYGNAPSGYWSSDLPNPYVDTQAFDPPEEKAVTIGTGTAYQLNAKKVYSYVTRFTSGGGNSSLVKLMAQRGRCGYPYYGNGCGTSTSFGCSSASNFEKVVPFRHDGSGYYAPGCREYWWQWPITTDRPYTCSYQ